MKLAYRRQNGFSPNPIPYTEIEAFCRMEQIVLSVWEVRTLCRLDNAVLAAMAGHQPTEAEQKGEVPITNRKALGALMRGLRVRKAAEKGRLATATAPPG